MDRHSSFRWRPRTTMLLLGGFAVVIVALVVSYVSANFRPTVAVTVNSGVYNVWLADDDTERTQGLSGVDKLSINGGMLFDYITDDMCGIWMKDMLISLDIIWLDANKKVVYLKENVSPQQGTSTVMRPKGLCRYVLELPAGSVKNSGIRVGQQVKFTLEGDTR